MVLIASVSIDVFKADFVKYPDEKVHSVNVDIYNTIAEIRNLSREINIELPLPLQKYKPKKIDEPFHNLRLIMLLSILREILTMYC